MGQPRVPVSAGRVILIVLGSIGVLLGLALLAGGGFLLWADRTQRDDGYLTTPTERFATPTYALTRSRLEVDTNGEGWVLNENWFGKIRIRGESPGDKNLFIGIGPQAEVSRYLGDVAHANVQDIDFDPFRATYLSVSGDAPQGPPTDQTFWAASASGVGQQTLTWKVRRGRRSGRQAGVAALGRHRDAHRRRARHRRKRRAGRAGRPETPATAGAVGTRYREPRA
jgi:hypothetical protein